MPIFIDIVKAPEPREWTEADWRLLPSLRRPQHSDTDGGWEIHPWLWRCPHGVYVTEDPYDFADFWGDEGEEITWCAPFCEVCYAKYEFEWRDIWKRLPKRRGTHFFKSRKLETGEFRYQREKLFDGRTVYPETFTKIIKLRDRTLTADLRLQEDPETGKPRLETMGGYVGKSFGYGRAGKGHGPDNDADDLRLSWMAQHEGSSIGYGEQDPQSTPWSATLPHVLGAPTDVPFRDFRVITAENWQPTPLPVGVSKPEPFRNYQGFLSERDYFADERTNHDGSVARVWKPISDGPFIIPASASLRDIKEIENRLSQHAANNYRAYLEAKSARRENRWWNEVAPLPPTARELAQWRRKRWNTGKASPHRVPIRRKRWPENWREEQRVRTSAGQETLAAKINMYRYGTGEIQAQKMCATAYENYRQAWISRGNYEGKTSVR